jgi:hypothetical protein
MNPEAVNTNSINTILEEDSRSAGDNSRSFLSEKRIYKNPDGSKGA